ncbi:protein ELF4-LIKE 4-like [Oryza brachyantha]|uniref:protein ELF4-LIKE 4-like n=1 Tax=Oryza brachyantha TaxID=4533 RepID=UPI001ADC65E0|nr:protein ELF4-LIKE 4-like [Oryza brachyantha]
MEEDSVVSNGGGGGGEEEEVAAANGGGVGGTARGGGGGGKVVQVLQRSFGEVQGILEQNRVLIQEISQNHEARDADGLTRNVALIRELNTNIARVVDLYANLSGSFSRSVTAAAASANNSTSPSSAAAAAAAKASKRPRATE